jgi:hypothetical protein
MYRWKCLLSLFFVLWAPNAFAYGVLAHEAMIDAAWEKSIVPLLRARFHPSADELQKARAFAYGGSLIQDLGYYPFSSRTFGDLTHYVRSGDFVTALIEDATDVDEYAFALGALSHYAADNDGHPLAVNPAVGLLYPKLRAKFGPDITYEENPSAHLKTEFGFDVVQIAHGAYVPTTYHELIGFQVSKPVLERAFRQTYGMDIKDVFGDIDLAIGTFRYAVKTMIPQMTKVAWETKHTEIEQLNPGATRSTFLFNLSRNDFNHEFGTKYEHPGVRSKMLAVILRVIPKVGPFRSLSFKLPTPEAEALFVKSFTASVERYRQLLSTVSSKPLPLSDRNLDTGKPTRAGEYRRVDEAYANLLARLQEHQFDQVSPALRANLLAFFSAAPKPAASKDLKRWQKIQASIEQLRARTAD